MCLSPLPLVLALAKTLGPKLASLGQRRPTSAKGRPRICNMLPSVGRTLANVDQCCEILAGSRPIPVNGWAKSARGWARCNPSPAPRGSRCATLGLTGVAVVGPSFVRMLANFGERLPARIGRGWARHRLPEQIFGSCRTSLEQPGATSGSPAGNFSRQLFWPPPYSFCCRRPQRSRLSPLRQPSRRAQRALLCMRPSPPPRRDSPEAARSWNSHSRGARERPAHGGRQRSWRPPGTWGSPAGERLVGLCFWGSAGGLLGPLQVAGLVRRSIKTARRAARRVAMPVAL